MTAPFDPRVALLNRERIAWGGTIGFAVTCFIAVYIGFALGVQL